MMMTIYSTHNMSETTTAGLVKFEELPAIAANAPEILMLNQNLLAKAQGRGQALLDTIAAEGMTDDLDKACNDFLVTCKVAIEKMNDRRSPITKMFTAIAKEFTTLEAPLDSSKPDSLYSKIQVERNLYAKKKAEIQRQKELEIQRKQAIEQEKIDLKARVEQCLRDAYLTKLYAFKAKGNAFFNEITLENIDIKKDEIEKLAIVYPRDKFYELPVTVTSVYLAKEDLAELIFDTRVKLYDELSANFRENMEDLKAHLLEQIPARKNELVEISKASKAEKQRLQDEADRRKKEEEIRIAREQDAAKREAENKVKISQDAETANTLFDAESEKAQLIDTSGAKVKNGYKITVLAPAGYQQIAAFWFSKFLNKTTIDQLEKKSLGQMKKDLETLAQASGGNDRIISEYVQYEEDFKAIAKK